MSTLLEDYFDFSEPEEICIQGHRVWLHHVLFEYLDGKTVEELGERFETLSMEQILAALLYYHRNRATMDRQLAELREHFDQEEAAERQSQAGLRDDLVRRLATNRAGRKDSA